MNDLCESRSLAGDSVNDVDAMKCEHDTHMNFLVPIACFIQGYHLLQIKTDASIKIFSLPASNHTACDKPDEKNGIFCTEHTSGYASASTDSKGKVGESRVTMP